MLQIPSTLPVREGQPFQKCNGDCTFARGGGLGRNRTLGPTAVVTDAYRSLLWYLLVGTRGGPNRARILDVLAESPQNAHRLAESLSLDYRTIRHHLALLEKNGLVTRPVGDAYATPYELSPHLALHFDVVQQVRSGQGISRRRPIMVTVGHPERGQP